MVFVNTGEVPLALSVPAVLCGMVVKWSLPILVSDQFQM